MNGTFGQRFQGPYRMPKGSGARVPPSKGGGSLAQPMGAPKKFDARGSYRDAFTSRAFAAAAECLAKKWGSPYVALANIDPAATRAGAAVLNRQLEQLLPTWLYSPGLDVKSWSRQGQRGANTDPRWYLPGLTNPNPGVPDSNVLYCPSAFNPSRRAINDYGPEVGMLWNTCGVFVPPLPSSPPDTMLFHIVKPGEPLWSPTEYGKWATVMLIRAPLNAPYVGLNGGPIPDYLLPKVQGRALPTPALDPASELWPQTELAPAYGGEGPYGRVRLAPYQKPVLGGMSISARVDPGGRMGPPVIGPAPPHNVVPPGKGEKERKINLNGDRLTKFIGDWGGKLSEFKDALNALADAIPHHPCKGLALQDKVVCVLRHADRINPAQAAYNLALNDLQDKVIGKMSHITNRNFGKAGYNKFGRGRSISRFAQNKWR